MKHGIVLLAGGLLVAGLGCGVGNGDEALRPQVLTPTKLTPQDVVAQRVADQVAEQNTPPCTLPAPFPVPESADYISGPPQECNGPDLTRKCVFGTAAPDTGVLLDFTSYAMPAGTWGTSSMGQITGGTSLYSGATTDGITQAVASDKLHVQATISAGGYTGIVFWFGPCLNASAFSGVQFGATGQLGGATMIVKTQTSPDYPIDAVNSKGKCPYKVDANKFTECQQPTANVASLPASGTVSLPWAMFTGGIPVPNIDPSQLLGFELQFSCPGGGSSCALNLDLGQVKFISP